MQNNPTAGPHQTTPTEINALFTGAKIVLEETPKAVTPFGGLGSLIAFLGRIGFVGQVQAALPFPAPTSNNAIPLAQTFTAFVVSVVTGARRFAHTQWLRADHTLHAMLGLERFPGDDTIRNFFHRFSQAQIQAFWRPLWKWTLELMNKRAEGFHLDLDSTVLQRSGHQQGAKKGYNPSRPGRFSHHPLLAVLGEAPFILHSWLRSGNTLASTGAASFLREALALLPSDIKIQCVRADSGFFEQQLVELLEERGLPYILVARMSKQIKQQCFKTREWQRIDEHHDVAEFRVQLMHWSKPLRFVAIRERVRQEQSSLGRTLIEVPGFTFRVWATNRNNPPMDIWREYNGRAIMEQRIEELKLELAVQGFCLHSFWATEAAFLSVLLTFNLLSLYQQATRPAQPYMQPATLRAGVFLAGAILGSVGRGLVVRLSAAWGGIQKHKPLVESALSWKIIASPKLDPPDDVSAVGGCAT